MNSRMALVATLCAVAATAVAAPRASAQRSSTITCESYGDRTRECRIPSGSEVRLVNQLSAASCDLNRTWGVGNGYLWVTRGCRAQFAVYAGYGDGGYGNGRSGRVGGGYGGYGNGGYDNVPYGGRGRGRGHDRNGDWDDRGQRNDGGYGDPGDRYGTGRAQQACMARARDAGLRVSDVGSWSRLSNGALRAEMWVTGRGREQGVTCTYDPRRDTASLGGWR